MADNLEHTDEGAIALAFVSALARGDFTRAREMLRTPLQNATSPESLRASYEQMLSYVESEADYLDVMSITHEPDDVARVYTAIIGSDFSEAVDLLICNEGGRLAIKDIFWGRP